VPSLEESLIDMELEPVHLALRSLLEQDTIRLLADMAEHPRTTAGTGSISLALDRKLNRQRSELFNVAWSRCEAFIRTAQLAYRSRAGIRHEPEEMTMPGLLGPVFRQRLAAAMRLPVIEARFTEPWTAAARRVLPSPSPQMTATAMWGPVIAWCALETVAESIDAERSEQIRLDLFDRLRLRKPLAESFNGLGFEGEAGWRAAARIKVVLLTEKGAGKLEAAVQTENAETSPVSSRYAEHVRPEPFKPEQRTPSAVVPVACGLPRDLWSDPDVRWLTGAHDADGSTYVIREPFEELLWWLQMPALLRLAGEPSSGRTEAQAISHTVRESLSAAEKAGYRLQTMLEEPRGETASQEISVP
jgi:hypothetical protein